MVGGPVAPLVGTRPGAKPRAAAVSILSNSALVPLKVVAGTVTGSVAILTAALHSALDLIASVVAFFSVRKADEPADASHPYGHEKMEDVAAAIEGVLILVGSWVIIFESVRRPIIGSHVEHLASASRSSASRSSRTWSCPRGCSSRPTPRTRRHSRPTPRTCVPTS